MRRLRDRLTLWVLIALGFCFALGSGLGMQRNQHGVDDFNQFYVGARLVFSGHLYDARAQAELQRETVGIARPGVSSWRLPFNYVMMWPLGRLPYGIARGIWFGLMIACAVGFVLVCPVGGPEKRDRPLCPLPLQTAAGMDFRQGQSGQSLFSARAMLAGVTAVSLPLFAATLGQRQDLTLLLLIVGISLALRARGHKIAAGVVLSFLAIKIHLFLLLPVALVMRRQWRMVAGLAGGGGVLAGVSFAAAGFGWVRDWLALANMPAVVTDAAVKPTLHGVLAGLPHSTTWEIVLSLGVVMATILAARNGFELAFAAAMLGSFLLSRHAYLHDCAILIPALMEIVWRAGSRGARWLAVTLLTPFPYFLPPLLMPVREGLAAAVLIAALLGWLVFDKPALTGGEQTA